MRHATRIAILAVLAVLLVACGGSNPAPTAMPPTAPTSTSAPAADTPLPPTDTPPPPTDTPSPPTDTPLPPTDTPPPPTETATSSTEPASAEDQRVVAEAEIPGEAAHAVDLIAAWAQAGAPDDDPFDYTGYDGATYQATYAADIQPLFTQEDVWFQGAPSCVSCHHDNLENAYHEMNLGTYEGIMAGGDRLSEPPGVPLLGQSAIGATDFDWDHAKLRERLRNNRMPPGMPFDVTEANRDGPLVDVGETEMTAVELLAAWVEAGAPETDPFGDNGATFAADVLPLFTEAELWYDDAPSCTSCHHANLENAYHELDLSSYDGIMAGGDRLSEPPGVPLLGQSAIGATDYDWDHSKLRGRLRNNRMPPGMPFDVTEANRDGPLVWRGEVFGGVTNTVAEGAQLRTGDCHIEAVDLIDAWVEAGGPDGAFSFTSREDESCIGEFAVDVQPLFTQEDVWFQGAPSCVSCHHDNLENAYHEMDLGSYDGIMAGGDRLSEPPGVPLLGQSAIGATDFDWEHAKLRERLRNNRMPPGMPFDVTEANRDGPLVDVGETEMTAVELLAAWVEAGAPETDPFGDNGATFAADVLPLFTEAELWYDDAPSCTSCHHANLKNAYHELDLSSYDGIMAGGDRLSEPPGVPLLGQSAIGATDYDWDHSKLRGRLRNNRMPPGMPFDVTEANRDGPLVQVGFVEGTERGATASGLDIDLTSPPTTDDVIPLINKGGCIACHTIPNVPGAVGKLGPAWCDVAEEFEDGEIDLAYLYESIVDPNAQVNDDFQPNLMPQNFAEIFDEDELSTLVAFIATLHCD